MFRRTFWFTAGAAAGVWATTKVHRKLRQLTPESLAAQAANKALDAGHRLKDFTLDVRDGMARREVELGEALGLTAPADPATSRALPPAHRAALPAEPAEPKATPAHRPPAAPAGHPGREAPAGRDTPQASGTRIPHASDRTIRNRRNEDH